MCVISAISCPDSPEEPGREQLKPRQQHLSVTSNTHLLSLPCLYVSEYSRGYLSVCTPKGVIPLLTSDTSHSLHLRTARPSVSEVKVISGPRYWSYQLQFVWFLQGSGCMLPAAEGSTQKETVVNKYCNNNDKGLSQPERSNTCNSAQQFYISILLKIFSTHSNTVIVL